MEVDTSGAGDSTKNEKAEDKSTENTVTDEDKAAIDEEEEKKRKLEEKRKESEKKKRSAELEKYWKPVRLNPGDFTGWTYLLQYVEQENMLTEAREAYEDFLSKYPYCYGYWKKYADLEKRNGDLTKATEVFEKGIKNIPLSCELWLHYIGFMQKDIKSEEETRKLYDRAVQSAGMDFRSDKLWTSYITWEKENDLKKVTAIYDKLLAIPTQLYSFHHDNFKKHILNSHPKDVLSLDEFIKLRTEVVNEKGVVADDDAPPGDDVPPGDEPPPGVNSDKGTDEEAMTVRDKVLKLREVVFKQNEEEVSKRWIYEEGIKRPYFHVKPLERSQLKNWREYLDYELQNGTHERVVVLFERCMIAAALYEDFWLKYARYLEDHFTGLKRAAMDNVKGFIQIDEQGLEAVRGVYKRACTTHLPKKPYIHLAWAAFEERQGSHNNAVKILSDLEEALPGMVMVAMRRISLERRIGNREKTEILFQEYIDKAVDCNVRAFYVIKYARFLFKVLGDAVEAKKRLLEALEKDPSNEKLYVQLLDMEYQKHPVDVDSAMEIFAKAMERDEVSINTKIKMSQRRLEFLEDFGSSIVQLKECYDEHQKLLKDIQTTEKKKRAAEPSAAVDQPAEKRPKANGAAEQQPVPSQPPPSVQQTPPPQQPPTSQMQQPDYSAYWAHYQNAYNNYNQGGWGAGYQQYYNS